MWKMWYCILVLICVLKGGGTVRRKRRIMSGLLALCIALSVLPLSACTAPKLTLDPEELYALPELPERIFLRGQLQLRLRLLFLKRSHT